ncbi:MAG: hypothetical protein JOZ42_07745 [Acetobacteraceae bacterium]|nr:hypothetical protein [Acetobacteraceae bacterium]
MPAGIAAIREAHLAYVASDPMAAYVGGLDVALAADGIHPSQAGNITFARHFYRAFLPLLNPASSGDHGPILTGTPWRRKGSATVTLPVQNAGGTALSAVGDATSQFQVFPSGQTTGAFSVSSVDVGSGSQIVLALAALPTDGQALDVWYRPAFDSPAAISGGIYDNNVEGGVPGSGRQLTISPACLTVPAPSQPWHSPVLVQPGVPLCVRPGALAFTC